MSESVEHELGVYTFDFSGDHLCLDFVNTLGDRLMEQPKEHLQSYTDLLAYSMQARLLSDEQAEELKKTMLRRPQEAQRVLEQAIELRELLGRIFLAIAQERSPDSEDLQRLGDQFAKVVQREHLVFHGEYYVWEWSITGEALDGLLWFIIKAAVELLTSNNLSSVHVCAADDCNWLFLDTSKNHSRRWCDMKSCGNRAKVRRFHGRKKQEFA
jgi:predicted RNA-binding Zn ribbon-like protein